MGKRVRLTDDSLNSYGSRVLTSGLDVAQYQRNPVLLYMHERGRVIGYMKDIEVNDGEVTGEPVFDLATPLSEQCSRQWAAGSLRMVSIGIDVVEMSESPEHLVPGQTSPTITRSRLYEVSVVDIGANDNAIVMRHDGRQITLGRESVNPLPLIANIKNDREMELKKVALAVGLEETADEAAVTARLAALRGADTERAVLERRVEEMEEARIAAAVDAAIAENRLTGDRRGQFVKLGKQVGLETLNETLAAMAPAARLGNVIDRSGDNPKEGGKARYGKLSEVPEAELKRMREAEPDEYRRLYKAEYGMECRI